MSLIIIEHSQSKEAIPPIVSKDKSKMYNSYNEEQLAKCCIIEMGDYSKRKYSLIPVPLKFFSRLILQETKRDKTNQSFAKMQVNVTKGSKWTGLKA